MSQIDTPPETLTETTPTPPVEATEARTPVQHWVVPSVDVLDKDGELRLLLDLPGVRAEGLTVRVEDAVLEVSAQRSDRPERGFRRSFRLPDTVDGAGIQAALRHGVLTLDLPRRAETRARTITVRVG
ncbi:MAG: Hsp20/alpha crystallin family protein [Alphaproteobacteria bacterium]|nr:Hsp20/alpha crystallin family protein [Alphaproteobacteria bacterium]